MYVFILQQDNNTQNIMPEGQQGPEAPAARNKNVSLAMTVTKHNKNPSLMNSGPERTT